MQNRNGSCESLDRSADFQSAVSRISNPPDERTLWRRRKLTGDQPNGIRRYSRLEICATESGAAVVYASSSRFRLLPDRLTLELQRLFITVVLLSGFPLLAAALPESEFAGQSPLQWSVSMADSQMARLGDRLAWKEGGSARWDYTAGLFTLSLLKLNERAPNPRYVEFTTNAIGSFIPADGKIHGYRIDEHNIDHIAPGKTVLALYQLTKEDRYRKAAALLRSQLDTHPRTTEGGFWHKRRYTNQMWLDGLFMGAPFYAEYTKLFNGPAAEYDDVAKQFRLIDKYLYDPKTGLFYHGWDEKHNQPWASPVTGTSSNFWGRAIGWYAMACVDVLDFLPKNHVARPEIITELKKVCDGVVKWQDKDSGLWWQVMDQGPRQGNYLEATASAMFVYSMSKGMNKGYLSRDYLPATLKGYKGIVEKLIKTEANGQVTLTQCCQVAGLGFLSMKGGPRDGSFEYYVSEPIIENDLKGVGPFILAGIELQELLRLPPPK